MPTDKTTPNVLRKKQIKQENRRRNKLAEQLEAREAGISVWELKLRKFVEVQEIRRHCGSVSFTSPANPGYSGMKSPSDYRDPFYDF